MERRPGGFVVLVVFLALVMFGVSLLGPPIRGVDHDPNAEKIAHHLREMKRAREAMFGERVTTLEGLTGHKIVASAEKQYEYHRQRLVELGYYFHRDFRFAQVPESMHGRLFRRAVSQFPGNDHITLSWPDNVMSVWDRVETRKEWERFYQRNNVASFK